ADRREDVGLQAVFKSVFPIADYNDNALLEFDSYHFGDPKYTVEECHDRGMTFAIPLKVTLRLVVFDHDKEAKTKTIREQRGQEILAHFYDIEDVLGFEDGNAWVKVHPEASVGAKVADDIRPPRHREPLVQAGKVLNAKLVEKLVEANVEKIPVRAEALVGRRTASKIVDSES